MPTIEYAYSCGVDDASSERNPIFAPDGRGGIVATIDDDMGDTWEEEAQAAYIRGYLADVAPFYSGE